MTARGCCKRSGDILLRYSASWSVSHVNVFAFLKDESGATAIEYGLIAAGISIVIIASVNSVGTTLNGTFSTVSTQLK